VAGSVPLVPYVLPALREHGLAWSAVATLTALFAVGAARTSVTVDRWWAAGLEMLVLGLVVAAAAYGAGALIASVV
jgi:VIT1/CCC1 family predicted Fe2+/Mn2+ transporter